MRKMLCSSLCVGSWAGSRGPGRVSGAQHTRHHRVIAQHRVPARGLRTVVMVTGSEVGMRLSCFCVLFCFFPLFPHLDHSCYVGVTCNHVKFSASFACVCRWTRYLMMSWTMEQRKTVTRRTRTWTRCLEPGWESWTSSHRLKYKYSHTH